MKSTDIHFIMNEWIRLYLAKLVPSSTESGIIPILSIINHLKTLQLSRKERSVLKILMDKNILRRFRVNYKVGQALFVLHFYRTYNVVFYLIRLK